MISAKKRKERQEEAQFQKLVTSYKKRLLSEDGSSRSVIEKRWFE
jgi:hypothetical protein